ncbi:MAG TPA: hypothetical protein PKI46_03930 [Bacteroidales bacterium]|nr:hypothetical protein [Bacteroidales bacterium]
MKNLIYILLGLFLFTSCTQDDTLAELNVNNVSFIEHYSDNIFQRTEALKITQGENYVKGKDSIQIKVSLVIEDDNPYVGKVYQLDGNDELARIYFNKGNHLQFASQGSLTITKLEQNKIEGIYEVYKATNVYYIDYGYPVDSIGQPYNLRLSSGKFLFNK